MKKCYMGKGVISYDFGEHKNCKWIKEKKIYPFPEYNQIDLDFVSENQNVTVIFRKSLSSAPCFISFFIGFKIKETY